MTLSHDQSTVWRYYAFTFFRNFAFFSAVLIPFYTEWGHISMVQVQILQSIFMLAIFLAEVPTGAIADYVGRKYSLMLGAITVALAVLIYGSVPRFEVFIVGEILFGIGFALVSGADSALLYDALKESGREGESKTVFGRAHAIHLAGILSAAPIGSIIAAKLGLNTPLLLTAIPFFMAAFIAASIREPKRFDKTSESRRYLDIMKQGFQYLYRHKLLRVIAFDAIAVASAAYFVLWLYQPLLQKISVPIFYFGFIHALMVVAEILIATNFSAIEKIVGSSTGYLRLTALITAVSFIGVSIAPNIVTVLLFIVLAGGFGLTRIEYLSAHINSLIPSSERATILSSISMFRRFALVILNPIVGYMVDHSLNLALMIVGLIPLGIFLLSPLRKIKLE